MKKNSNYFKLENILIDDYEIKENDNYEVVSLFSNIYEKSVFAVIERYNKNSIDFPNHTEIAKILFCSKSKIEKTIKSLKKKKLITDTNHPYKKSKIYMTCNLQEKYLEFYKSEILSSKKNEIN